MTDTSVQVITLRCPHCGRVDTIPNDPPATDGEIGPHWCNPDDGGCGVTSTARYSTRDGRVKTQLTERKPE